MINAPAPQPGFTRHFKACNRHDLTNYLPFQVDGKNYGWVHRDLAAILLSAHRDHLLQTTTGITLSPHLRDFTTRSAVLAHATETLAQHTGKKLRHEMYPLLSAWGDEPLAQLDRAAVPWFGIRAFGVHVNGYVKKPDGIYIWIGERAADRSVDPGLLDNMIGGGQPIGLSIRENLKKEAHEEAGLSGTVIDNAVHARTMRYMLERQGGIRNDTLFVFDVEMTGDLVPTNTDGEVAAFRLLPAHEVAKIIFETDRFKFNCNIVIIDFLIRHGIITSEHTEFAELMTYLPQSHTPDHFAD